MARILSGADFGVTFPQNGGVANNDFGNALSAQLLGQALRFYQQDNLQENSQAFQTNRDEQVLALKSQQAEQVALAQSEKTRLEGLFAQIERIRNMADSPAKRTELAKLGQSEFEAGRDGSEFIQALNASTPDQFNLNLSTLSTKAGTLAGQLDEVLKQNAPPEATTDIGKAREDLQGGKITQADFNLIRNAPKEFQTDVGKMISDKQIAIEMFGADSPQVQAFNEAIELEATGEGPKLTDIAGLRKEFTKQSTDFIKIRDAYSRIQSASDSGPGDVSLIFGFMKLIDPGSTVREGEFATAEQTQGIPDQITNMYNKAMRGERLGETARAQFKAEADNLFSAQKEAQLQLETVFQGVASRQDMNPDDVAIDFIGDLRTLEPPTVVDTGFTAQQLLDMTPEQRKELRDSLIP